MTFEQWFDQEYPESAFAAHMQIMRLSLKEVAHKAWLAGSEKGFEEGKIFERY